MKSILPLNKKLNSIRNLVTIQDKWNSYRAAAITARGFGEEESRKVAELIIKPLRMQKMRLS